MYLCVVLRCWCPASSWIDFAVAPRIGQTRAEDLKPANIFYGEGGVRVGDFGLAKYVDEATRSKTFKGWGTVPYMAREVSKGTSLDCRADQYALGVVFFEVATFSLPFEGSTEELEQAEAMKGAAEHFSGDQLSPVRRGSARTCSYEVLSLE